MVDRRIRKIRNQALDLALRGGADVLFVCEMPEDPTGDGSVFLFGNEDSPTILLCAHRTLNELKDKLRHAGLDFEYTLTQRRKEVEDGE